MSLTARVGHMTSFKDHALDLAGRGWRVFPLATGRKTPAVKEWQKVATLDTEQIDAWWDRNPDSGVGIATGKESGIFVVDVDIKEGKRGDETLRDLEQQFADMPVTVQAITGSGGLHYYFKYPEEGRVTNSNTLGPDIDLRGDGGYVVSPGSIHPDTNNLYEWEVESHPDDIPVATAPSWLLERCKPRVSVDHANDVGRKALAGNAVAADNYDGSATNSMVASVLVSQGWAIDYTDKYGVIYIRRPGKDDGFSASIGKVGEGVMFCFTSSAAPFKQDTPYDPVGVLAYAKYGGDMEAADAELVEEGWGCASFSLDMDAVFEIWDQELAERAFHAISGDIIPLSQLYGVKYDPPKGTALLRQDGIGGIYEKAIHALVGEPETGKSWVSQYLVVEQMKAGKSTMFWDFEGSSNSFMHRMYLLGLSDEDCRKSFYIKPMVPNEHTIAGMVEMVKLNDVKFIVIDSVNRIMGRMGLNYESGPDYIKFTTIIADPLVEAGAAVIVVDHVVKSKENRGRYATGSEQKLGQVDVSLHFETIRQFAPGIEGTIGIRIAKDRHGGIKEYSYGSGERRRWGLFHLGEDRDTGLKIVTIEPWEQAASGPASDKSYQKHWPGQLLKAITDVLIDMGAMEHKELRFWIDCKQADFDFAYDLLVREGYLNTRVNASDSKQPPKIYVVDKGYNPKFDKRAAEYDEREIPDV